MFDGYWSRCYILIMRKKLGALSVKCPTWNALVVLLTLSFVRPSIASDWQTYKSDCDKVFNSHRTIVIQRLKECVGLWTAYVDPNVVKPQEAQRLKIAFQGLYDRSMNAGDEEGEFLARGAAERLRARLVLKLKRDPTTASGTGDAERPQKRKKFVSPEVSVGDQRRAEKEVKKGIKFFKRKKRDKAMAAYKRALAFDPGNLNGIYNLAAEYAFRKQAGDAVDQLLKLKDIGTNGAVARLQEARVDPDFEPIHDDVAYKKVTGYARIKLVNSIGMFGEDEVDRIEKTLRKLKHRDVEQGIDKKQGRTAPVIWFKDHSAATAWVVKKTLIHPGTLMTKIHWDTPYDIVVSWGNKIVKRDGVKQPQKDYTDVNPEKAEKRLSDLRREEDKALREPEKVARKIDHTVDTPKRIQNSVEGGVRRAERTVDTIKNTGGKVKRMFK